MRVASQHARLGMTAPPAPAGRRAGLCPRGHTALYVHATRRVTPARGVPGWCGMQVQTSDQRATAQGGPRCNAGGAGYRILGRNRPYLIIPGTTDERRGHPYR